MNLSLNQKINKDAGSLSTLLAVYRVFVAFGVVMGFAFVGLGFFAYQEEAAEIVSQMAFYAISGLGLLLILIGGLIMWRYCTLGMDWLRGLRSRVEPTNNVVSNGEFLNTQKRLDKWLGFYIWSNFAILLMLLPMSIMFIQEMINYNPFFNAQEVIIGAIIGIAVFAIFVVLFVYFPTQAIRQFIEKATHRLNGETLRIEDSAKKVSTWMIVFIAFMVLSTLGSFIDVYTTMNTPVNLTELDAAESQMSQSIAVAGAAGAAFFNLIINALFAWSFWLMHNIALRTAKLMDDPNAATLTETEKIH